MQWKKAVDCVSSGMTRNMNGSNYALSDYDFLVWIEVNIGSFYELFVMKSYYHLDGWIYFLQLWAKLFWSSSVIPMFMGV